MRAGVAERPLTGRPVNASQDGSSHERALRDGDHRRRPGRPVGRLPPRAARPVVRDPGGRATRVGDNWRNRFDSLRLYSPARYDGLPGWGVPLDRWAFPTKDEIADYLEAYAQRFELPVVTGVARRRACARDGDRYVVRAGAHRFTADNVVVASGTFQQPIVPRVRRRARPGDRAAALQRLPQPVAAAGRARARRRLRATRAPTSRSRSPRATRPSCPAGSTARCRSTSRARPARLGAARARGSWRTTCSP